MTGPELIKLHRENHAAGGTMDDLIAKYRKATNSEAKDASLKSTISNQLKEFRDGLVARGHSEESVLEVIPKYRKGRKANKVEEGIDFAESLLTPADAGAAE